MTSPVLRQFSLFRDAPETALQQLALCASTHIFAEDDRLWLMGDDPVTAHFIVRGLVQVMRPLPNGDEVTLGLFGPLECAGILSVLGTRQPYPAEALAASRDVEVIRMPATALISVLAAEPAISRAANGVLAHHAQMLRAKIDVLTAGEIPQRLATFLLQAAERFGSQDAGGGVQVPVVLSRRTLSRLVGAREETVIRVMTRWARESLVETTDSGFLLRNPSALTAVMDGQAT